jgi:MYXO-CTERM domain-containing protein
MYWQSVICRPVLLGVAAILSPAVWPQDATRGAALYMRLANDSNSCVSCHGPDPGLNPNNILRAADQPNVLVKVLNTVGVMGFLRPQLSEQDHRDITAFLGSVLRLNAPGAPVRMWPVTMDFGSMAVNTFSALQIVRIENTSAMASVGISGISATHSSVEVTHDCPAELAPAAACTLFVRVRPAATGLVHAAVQVTTQGQPQVVALVAKGANFATSQLDWQGIAATADFVAGAPHTPSRQTFRLTNSGPLPAVLGQTSLVGPHASQFRVENGCRSGQVLLAFTSCDLVLSFSANLLAKPQALLQLRSDQVNPGAVQLQGAGADGVDAGPLPVDSQTPTPTAMPAPTPQLPEQAGGGCSVASAPPKRPDIALMLSVLGALLGLGFKRPRPAR